MTLRKASGNILFIILIAVALFGALSVAISQSDRWGGDSEKEKTIIANATSEYCTTSVELGAQRLQTINGCTPAQISYEVPGGYNINPDAPTDKSCHIFHANGAGLAPCGVYETPDCVLTNLTLGETCPGTDIVFAGLLGGTRIYTTTTDQTSGIIWGQSGSIGASSLTDGPGNTDDMLAAEPANALANLCRSLGPEWYVPAINELTLFYTNRAAIGGFSDRYWASTTAANSDAWMMNFTTGASNQYMTRYIWSLKARCARRD